MNIVIITGSNRRASTSTKLAEYIKEYIVRREYQVKLFDLYRTPLPFYSPDESFYDHKGLAELQSAMKKADAIVLASPEYHGGMSGVLKNALDHLGQTHFSGKPVLCVSSAGGAVGVSSLQQMQATVRNLHGINCPEWLSIGGSQRQRFELENADYEDGNEIEARIRRVVDSFLRLAQIVRARSNLEAEVSL
ncbi:NADPH-dependent FMN reductase [Paenibacillus sediminis]|uniref:Azobenzene reductase n=1 Tax=Paenibacillus sediminis TaxID=664909 RepID=A0ABS4H6G9_9BACL|nr:NADPH-dependent FMN reductase [Paenibacillus sediminis]MBP1938076.1 azobenzene reductase [Paenibacillus sediminis]